MFYSFVYLLIDLPTCQLTMGEHASIPGELYISEHVFVFEAKELKPFWVHSHFDELLIDY